MESSCELIERIHHITSPSIYRTESDKRVTIQSIERIVSEWLEERAVLVGKKKSGKRSNVSPKLDYLEVYP